MIMNDEERVTKSTKLSAGLFRERWDETDMRKAIRVWRQEAGNEFSVGSTGEYHHLHSVRPGIPQHPPNIPDIVPYDGIGQLSEGCCRLGPELGIVEFLPRIQLQVKVIVIVLALLFAVGSCIPPVQHSLHNVYAALTPYRLVFSVSARQSLP
jgi:hypothetical protein